jgi:hypothetical protein
MGASSVQQESRDEFRWTIAALAALTCCAMMLAATLVLMTGNERFDYRPPAAISSYDDQLVRDFEALHATDAAKRDAMSASTKIPQTSRATSPEPGHDFIASSTGANQCPTDSWPYSRDKCRWAADANKRQRIVVRLKSPWCSGALRHQLFYNCRPRPK